MRRHNCGEYPEIRDYGCEPFIFNIDHATNMNKNFRTTLWTGRDMQLTLMSIPVCGDIGVEMHQDVDQFIRVESGRATVYMGNCRNDLREIGCVDGNYAILIPAGAWHYRKLHRSKSSSKACCIPRDPKDPAGSIQKAGSRSGIY